MSTSDFPTSDSVAALRLQAERDRVERSPAQPTGPDRIDDDGAVEPSTESSPPHVKIERPGCMEH